MASRNGRVSRELRRQILAQVSKGRTAVDVAREHGIHPCNISRWKKDDGPSPAVETSSELSTGSTDRLTGRYSRTFKEEVLRQVASGRTADDVATQYRVTPTTIYRWKKAAANAGGQLPDAQKRHRSHPAISATPDRRE